MSSFEKRQQTTPNVTTFSRNSWPGGEILPFESDYVWQGDQLSKDYGVQEDRQYIPSFRAEVENSGQLGLALTMLNLLPSERARC